MIGYHHICDAEHYFSHQLAKTSLIPDDLRTSGLHLDLRKLPRSQIIGVFCSIFYHQLTSSIPECALAMLSTLCPQLQTFSDSFCIEKDIQNQAFRSLVEAYTALIVRSDRMHLSFWHYWVAPINPVLRLLNKECRIPFLYQPRLFDFQIHAEIQFQLQHFLAESRQSMDRVEANINRFEPHPLDHSLKSATKTFEEFQRHIGQERGRTRSYNFEFMHYLLPTNYFYSPEGVKRLNEYYDLSTRILQRLKDLGTSLAAYDTSIVHMKRQHNRLLAIMASESLFDLGRNGVISVPNFEVSNLANASFVDFQTPSLAPPEDGATRDVFHYSYDLDTVFSPSHRAALRQGVVQLCLEETNVKIVSGFLYTICALWRHVISRSEFDNDLLSAVQRSWSFEQTKAVVEHRELMSYGDESISGDFVRYYREYQLGEEGPAFV